MYSTGFLNICILYCPSMISIENSGCVSLQNFATTVLFCCLRFSNMLTPVAQGTSGFHLVGRTTHWAQHPGTNERGERVAAWTCIRTHDLLIPSPVPLQLGHTWRETRLFWRLPLVWNHPAVIWFHSSICSLVCLPCPDFCLLPFLLLTHSPANF